MKYGIYLHINTAEDRSYAFKFKNPFNTTDHPLPGELLIIKEIIVGYKCLDNDTPAKIKVFNNETEVELLNNFYTFFSKLTLNEKKVEQYIIGYDLKRYIIPTLIKSLLLKHKIIKSYYELPEILKFKDTKPWEVTNIIDLKEELSFGAFHVPFEYVKHYMGYNGTTIEEELDFIINKLTI